MDDHPLSSTHTRYPRRDQAFINDSTNAYSALTFASSSGKTKLLRQP